MVLYWTLVVILFELCGLIVSQRNVLFYTFNSVLQPKSPVITVGIWEVEVHVQQSDHVVLSVDK